MRFGSNISVKSTISYLWGGGAHFFCQERPEYSGTLAQLVQMIWACQIQVASTLIRDACAELIYNSCMHPALR